MFSDKYKKAMDEINPSNEALERTLNAINEEGSKKTTSKRLFRNLAIACLSVCLILTTVLAAFKFDNIVKFFKGEDINISEVQSQEANESNNESTPNQTIKFDGLRNAKSYEEIYSLIKENNRDYGGGIIWSDEMFEIEEDVELEEPTDSPSYEAAPDGTPNSPEHSDTNNQVLGVQESDIVKNDGKYIYYCNIRNRVINITSVKDGEMKKCSTINLETNLDDINSMFLFGDKLAVIGQNYKNSKLYSEVKTICIYYDITDRNNPVLLNSLSQDGDYIDSRATNGSVYIISNKYAYRYGQYEDDSKIIPEVADDLIAPNDILIPDDIKSSNFTVITAYDIESESDAHTSSLAILGGSRTIYCSKDNIYITNIHTKSHRDEDAEKNVPLSFYDTTIFRIALNKGELGVTGTGQIPGKVDNQFWFDEKDGKLRVAAIVQMCTFGEDGYGAWMNMNPEEQFNRVYCLDENLEIIGQSDKLGVTEMIKSVRYIGDIAYVVTFRQTDPLYAIDLSDPTNPKTLSELKIDGFSSYMQPYGSNLMLGIGFDADPNTGIEKGLKLTMFDITDPKNISDISTYTYKWQRDGIAFSSSEATYNHKALLLDAKKGIIAIPLAHSYERIVFNGDFEEYHWINESYYVIFEFDGTTLKERGRIETGDDLKSWYDNSRGLYIGDYGYVVSDNGIISFSLNDLETVAKIEF